MRLEWTRSKCDGVTIYTAKDDYHEYEIRNWGYGGVNHDEGHVQYCEDGYERGNFFTVTGAKEFAENWSN